MEGKVGFSHLSANKTPMSRVRYIWEQRCSLPVSL